MEDKFCLRQVSLLEKMSKPKNEDVKPAPVMPQKSNAIKVEPAIVDKDMVEKVRAEVKSELDDEILGEIIAGNDMNAQLMLMQKKGLSLSAAVTYIEETKNSIK